MENVVDIKNGRYPFLLKEISNPPEKIYYKGNWNSALFEKCLAVVGSRKMTRYGEKITETLISEIAKAGITIVSGFMYGIDAAAHRAALNAGGKTIAVMPCGIERIHPEYQQDLHKEIVDNGLVISELENKYPPMLWTYPRRNRIIAALSQATLVVEAAGKSGSLITARLAHKYKRKVFAVPGPLSSSVSQGTTKLIKDGAEIVTCAGDILKYFDVEKVSAISRDSQPFLELNRLEKSIIEELRRQPHDVDELSRLVETSVSKLGTTLSLMQLKGLLLQECGKYCLNN